MTEQADVRRAHSAEQDVVSEKFISLADRLHRLWREAAAVEEYRQLIAAEQMVGEDVVVKVAV